MRTDFHLDALCGEKEGSVVLSIMTTRGTTAIPWVFQTLVTIRTREISLLVLEERRGCVYRGLYLACYALLLNPCHNMASTATLKSENEIKPDPELGSPTSLVDDDTYEDTGELEIPKLPPAAWLLRIPKILYEGWAGIDDDEEIKLGVIRHYTKSNKACFSTV